jgi:hypothetical protein
VSNFKTKRSIMNGQASNKNEVKQSVVFGVEGNGKQASTSRKRGLYDYRKDW